METLNVEKEYRLRDLSMFSDDILEAREYEICGGCGRTKKACQKADGSGCDWR